jgi:hypothetical protein
MSPRRSFRAGDLVVHGDSKTEMKIIGRSSAVTSEIVWECEWYRADMTKARRAFVESTLRHAKQDEGGKVPA